MDYLDEACGILVEPDSYSALVNGFTEAMQRLIETPALAKSMGAAGRRRAVRDFDWERRIDHVIDMYRTLIEKPEEAQDINSSDIRTQPKDADQFRMKMTN